MKVKVSDTWSDGEKVRDYGSVLCITHNGKVLIEETDTMEPEDASFGRNLNWIKAAIELAYKLGKEEIDLSAKMEIRT